MIKPNEMSLFSEVFAHVEEDGTNIHICVDKLRDFLQKEDFEVKKMPVEKGFVQEIIDTKAVSLPHIEKLLDSYAKGLRKLEPIIVAVHGGTAEVPDVLLVDGHHRYVMAAFCGASHIPAYLVPEIIWRRFQVEGLPTLTRQELIDSPVIKVECVR